MTTDLPRWRLTTLGAVCLESADGAKATLRTRAAVALLADLAMHPERDWPREELADRHWSEDDEETARAKLRLALHSIRRELGAVLAAERGSVRLCEGGVVLDAREFALLLRRAGLAEGAARIASLEAAIGMVAGPFLPGHWDDWAVGERARLDGLLAGALLDLARAHLDAERPEGAIEPARRLLAQEPYDAGGHVALLDALARLGCAGAIGRHLDAAHAIYAEIGSTPPAEVLAYGRVKREAVEIAGGEELFVGREAELASLHGHLQTPGLVVLWGPPGIGKTRLARELLASSGDADRFLAAAALGSPADLLLALRARFAPGSEAHPDPLGDAADLAPALGDAPVVLDDFQALAPKGGREVVAAMLGANPALRLVVTSQLRLGLSGERVIALEPLASPEPGTDAARAALFPAVQLLVARARGPLASREGLGDLGRALGGNPLAIEVAADWLRALTPAEVLARLGRGSRSGGGRTLEGAIGLSLGLLSVESRAFLVALSVHEGGWDLLSAGAVGRCEDPAPLLADLVDRSLVTVAPWRDRARYDLLEAVRDVVRSEAPPADLDAARDRHAEHFALRAEADGVALADVFGPDPRDDANLDLALDRAFKRWDDAERCARFVQAFAIGTLHRGRDAAVRGRIEAALARLPVTPSRLRAKLVNGLGTLAYSAGDLDEAERRFRERRGLHEAEGDAFETLVAENNLAAVLQRRGDFEGALATMARIVGRLEAEFPERDRLYPEISLGELLILVGGDEGIDRGREIVRSVLAAASAQERPILAGHCLAILGRSERTLGRPAEAVPSFRRALELYERHEGRAHLVETGALLAGVACEAGLGEEARGALSRAAERLGAAPTWSGTIGTSEAAAIVAAEEGRWREAAGFLAAAETASARARHRAEPAVRTRLDAMNRRLAGELGTEALAEARLLAETETRTDLVRALSDFASA